jgi:hypothetical protein
MADMCSPADRAGMRLFDHAAESRVNRHGFIHRRRVIHLVGVVIHLNIAIRAPHLLSCFHLFPQQFLILRDMLAPVAQDLRHPYKLLQKLVYALDIRLIKELSVLVEELLRAGKVSVPEDCDQPKLAQDG